MASCKITELNVSNTCKFCNNALAKYSCPRCNLMYCSLDCYKSEIHLDCSENFYKDCVYENLQLCSNDVDDAKKMSEILQRVYKQDEEEDNNDDKEDADLDSDDEVFPDIQERLANVNLDDTEQVWDKLTSDEKQEFEAFLRSGDVTKLIPKWEPWWIYNSNKKIEDVIEIENHKKKCPKIIENISNFKDIFKKEPADSVKFNLINILAAYVFTVRYFNGDHLEFVNEALSYIINLSLTLKKNINFIDFSTAVDSIQQEIISNDWILADEENIELMKTDLGMLLKGPHITEKNYYVLCALSNLCNTIKASKKVNSNKSESKFKNILPESQFPSVKFIEKEQLKLIRKKIDFFLSYSKDVLEI